MSDLLLSDAAATEALGARLAQTLPERAVVHLHGDLGAGKSTLARALLRALGVTGTIRSPTYTLVEQYLLPAGGLALHLDLYRIGNPGELEFLGLDPAEARLWLVEWPERGQGALPPADLDIELAVDGDGRCCVLRPQTAAGRAWAEALRTG
ncbi:tRNA (adenosine(37)-N6)-threonylcarbamoyltransferase complex ATPase subunit type 1 TsaE [Thermomonas brevis]|uniref:tRNA threonylcarbamoyladenosine biosynthesis protein TsaE n=1 Tax=Thermomonas brevis TaxID=215691 RepID=A0A7G9QV72_9GAMM|nr:tRNA (adenosine(37)-N6)-threonylcarbamoyltransferase complex ATPase subunit type 1 TsaE [Thermomonas brevis]QNN47247.1 tRNA (adenosine(37)-N6)-threonylcarbamoyltransferase complex ATPase subunit type 1 TsaE [Thermomonas brevis]